jgi:hypothetical protein
MNDEDFNRMIRRMEENLSLPPGWRDNLPTPPPKTFRQRVKDKLVPALIWCGSVVLILGLVSLTPCWMERDLIGWCVHDFSWEEFFGIRKF